MTTEKKNVVGNNNDAAATIAPPRILFQTRFRQAITPYLPPPVIQAMKEIDPQLEPLVGPEASITIAGSLLVAYVLFWIVSKLVFGGGTSIASGGKAIQDDDDDHDQEVLLQSSNDHNEIACDGTIVLCGPSLGGKTTLFYHLLYPNSRSNGNSIQTVKSIKSNTGFLPIPTSSSSATSATWKLVDTPGQWGPEKLLQAISVAQQQQQEVQQRVVLVVDSTQPVAPAADYLQAVYLALLQTQATRDKDANMAPQILIACHKSQHPKAKNMRRLKLQLRSELERLQKFTSNKDATDDKSHASSAIINWEQVLNDDVLICSSDIQNNNLLQDVEQFCRSGTLQASSNSISKK